MKKGIYLIVFFCSTLLASAQVENLKKATTASEVEYITKTFEEISRTDQLYRNPLAKGTLDRSIIHLIDSMYDADGIQAGLIYEKSLNLKIPEHVKDSLWELQHVLDFRNHLYLRGIFETYGWVSEDVVKEKNFVQLLMLMHPPKDWEIPLYLETYTAMFLEEVESGRMPAKTFAMFYDNIKGKILREPQLYGTNQQFDPETNTILPPGIENLEASNEARRKIGLPDLKEGEYRTISVK